MSTALRSVSIVLVLLGSAACATPPAATANRTATGPGARLPAAALQAPAPRTGPFQTSPATSTAPVADVSPQRPSLSSDTNVAAEGFAELESGVAWDPHDRLDVPLSLRVGVAPDTEAYLNVSPLSITRLPGRDAHGFSDPEFGVRWRTSHDPDGLSTAMLASVKLPVSDKDEGLSTGEADAYLGAIVSGNLGPVSLLGFYRLGALGERRGGLDVEHAGSLVAGLGLTERLGSYVELAAQLVPDQRVQDVYVISGMNYVLDGGSVLDWGVQTGLSEDAAHTRALLGWTVNLGRWK